MPGKRTHKLLPLDYGSETIGQRLARIRKERGYTQVALAKEVGTVQGIMSDYENDKLRLSADMAVRFALVLNVSLDELLHPKVKQVSGKKPSRKVLRRLEQIESLPEYQQRALLTTIDNFIAAAQAR